MIHFRGRNTLFCLDSEAALLRRGARQIDLPGRQYELLKYIAERPGKLVTWDELRETVWGGDNVNDEAISRTLYKLRRSLGDEQPTIIKTKRGYGVRFVGVIESGPSSSDTKAGAPSRAALPTAQIVSSTISTKNNEPTAETPVSDTSNTLPPGSNEDRHSSEIDDRTVNKSGGDVKYTEGDWIAAAIVGSEHAETRLKGLAAEFRKLTGFDRIQKVEHIERKVESVIEKLLEKHANGGKNGRNSF